jgi:hypothetical protein
VDDAEGATLLFDAKPAGAVRGVRVLINARGELLLEHLDNII